MSRAQHGALLASLMLAGCADPFGDAGTPWYEAPPEALDSIDPIRFLDYAEEEPVSINDAAARDLERIVEAPPPADAISVTIENARAAALAHNLDLKVELIAPEIARTSVDEEEAKFEATFVGSARYLETDAPTGVATEGSETTLNDYNAGVNVPLPTGGTFDFNVPFSKFGTDNPFSLLDPAYEADFQLSISQPILRGGWIEANHHSIRVARGDLQATTAGTKLEVIRILANADRAYWLVFAAERELEVRQDEYRLAVEQLERARRRVQAGDLAEIEIIRAQSGVADTLEGIIRADTARRRAQRDLKRIMNRPDVPIDSPTALQVATEPEPVFTDLDPEKLSEYALENRMELLELEIRLAIDASAIAFQKNQALPLFVVDYTYTSNGLSDRFSDAFGDARDFVFEDHNVGARVEIPLGNEAAKARVHRAILSRLQRLATREQRRLAIVQEVYDALDVLAETWHRIIAARLQVLTARRTYEGEQRQFEIGTRTSTDVLDASTRLADAQSNEVRALADYQIALVDLAFATGTLLGKDRIRWEPDSGLMAGQ